MGTRKVQNNSSRIKLPTMPAVITQSRALFGTDIVSKTILNALIETGSQITLGDLEFF